MQALIRPKIMIVALVALTVWSAYKPVNPLVWYFEALSALALIGGLAWTCRYWPLTPLSNSLVAAGTALMLIGAHYTYSGMPLFSLLRDSLELSRNHFDRFGHLFQGAVPAIVLREMLIRRHVVSSSAWLFVLVIGFCLALSAAWEIVEWIAVAAAGGTPDVYLSYQGDPWDTQSDMACALVGAVGGLVLFGRMHDRQLAAAPVCD